MNTRRYLVILRRFCLVNLIRKIRHWLNWTYIWLMKDSVLPYHCQNEKKRPSFHNLLFMVSFERTISWTQRTSLSCRCTILRECRHWQVIFISIIALSLLKQKWDKNYCYFAIFVSVPSTRLHINSCKGRKKQQTIISSYVFRNCSLLVR
jgi:hypothetical protein